MYVLTGLWRIASLAGWWLEGGGVVNKAQQLWYNQQQQQIVTNGQAAAIAVGGFAILAAETGAVWAGSTY
jgi:hypothetical protein